MLRKFTLFFGSLVSYFLLAIYSRPLLGDAVTDLSVFPVVLVTWQINFLAGLACSLCIVLLEGLFQLQAGSSLIGYSGVKMVVVGLLTLVSSGLLTTGARKLWNHLQKEQPDRQPMDTSHLMSEVMLREGEEKYRLLFENMVEGIFITQLKYSAEGSLVDWVVKDVNPAFEKMLNLPGDIMVENRAGMFLEKIENSDLLLKNFQFASQAGVPITFEARTINQLDLLLTATPMKHNRLAVIVNDITEQKRAMDSERDQRRLAEALRDIAAALTGTLELESVLDRILLHIRQVASFDAVNIMLIERDEVRVVRHQGYIERGLDDYINKLNLQVSGAYGLRLMTEFRKAIVIPDTMNDQGWLIFPPTAWIRSYVGIPIEARGELIGFINFNSATPDFFRSGFVDRLQPFIDQAALAIFNAKTFEGTERRAHRLAVMNRVAETLNHPLELNAVLQMTVDCMTDALGLLQVGLALYDPQRDRLTVAADHPLPGSPSRVGADLTVVGNSSLEYIFSEKTSLYIEDTQKDIRVSTIRNLIQQRSIYSWLMLPIVVRGDVIGVIGCEVTDPSRKLVDEEIQLAETITNMAAVRIEQARLFSEVRKRASELALLHVTSLDITMHKDLPALLQTVVERATWLLDAPTGALYLVDPEKRELECQVSYHAPLNQLGTVLRYHEDVVGKVATSGKPVVIDNYGEWPEKILTENQVGEFLTVAGVPITWQNNIIGVIELGRVDPQRSFSEEEIDLLSLFSNQVAISLENARLYNEVQQIAIEDTLTKLYNRRGLFEVGSREIARSRRFQRPLTVVMMDIDHFKVVNDTYGHLVGDQVLIGLADLCSKNLRSVDIAGRFGGEEFLILLVENDLESGQAVVERIRQLTAEQPFPTSAGPISITVSVGAAELEESMTSLNDLIQAADEALYQAKRTGRNQVVFYQKHTA